MHSVGPNYLFAETARGDIVIMAFLGLFLLLLLAIPVLVILVVSPRTHGAVITAGKFLAGLLALIVVAGLFTLGARNQRSTESELRIRAQTAAMHRKIDAQFHHTEPPPAESSDGVDNSPEAPGGEWAATLENLTTSRPDWVGKPAELKDKTYRIEVKTGPWSTGAECRQDLQKAIRAATEEYASLYFGVAPEPGTVPLDSAELQAHLIRQPVYDETVEASVGPMHHWHALLEFDDQARGELHRLWRQGFVYERLNWAAGGFGAVLGALAVVFVFLKFDSRGRKPAAAASQA